MNTHSRAQRIASGGTAGLQTVACIHKPARVFRQEKERNEIFGLRESNADLLVYPVNFDSLIIVLEDEDIVMPHLRQAHCAHLAKADVVSAARPLD
jgi:hypothetical protein